MSRLFVQGCEKPRLEQSRSSIGPDGLGCLTPGRTRYYEGVCVPLQVKVGARVPAPRAVPRPHLQSTPGVFFAIYVMNSKRKTRA